MDERTRSDAASGGPTPRTDRVVGIALAMGLPIFLWNTAWPHAAEDLGFSLDSQDLSLFHVVPVLVLEVASIAVASRTPHPSRKWSVMASRPRVASRNLARSAFTRSVSRAWTIVDFF